jgi:hypothetical protein
VCLSACVISLSSAALPSSSLECLESACKKGNAAAVVARTRNSASEVLSSPAIGAQLLYAAPSHLVCTISGYRQYVMAIVDHSPALDTISDRALYKPS